jgi:hypothetical protein
MSNPKRGQIEINLAGNTYKTKVTLDAIVRIENAVGCSIIKVAQRLSEGELTTTEIVSILTPIIRSGGNDLKNKEVMKIVWEAGLMESMKTVGEVISSALDTSDLGDDEGNVQAGND